MASLNTVIFQKRMKLLHPISVSAKYIFCTAFFACVFFNQIGWAQNFPNPADLTTGQGPQGTADPIWTVSQNWYPALPVPNPMTLNYTTALINYNCAPGSWVDAASLPPPVNNGNWITGGEQNCANNTAAGYRFFRLQLNLPADCNGYSVTVPGAYVLSFDGYVDNSITEVYINGAPQGISGGGFSAGSQLSFTLNGPWLVGINYVDILVYNVPNGGGTNPYGLLLVASPTAPTDTDNDGVPNINDLCPCVAGNNPFGCIDPPQYGCDFNAIRTAFNGAGCIELPGCSDDCSMYFLNPQSMTGSAAQAFAQTLGANLVSIQSAAENACIISSINSINQGGIIWIGFSDEVQEGNFVWYDQAPVTYTNWAPGEPNNQGNEDCTQIYADGLWNDLPCNIGNAKSIIEINLCPVVNAGLDVAICAGNTANLQASNSLFGSAPYTYAWSNGPQVQPNPVSPASQATYVVTTEDRYSCSSSDTVVVSVNPLPNVTAGPDIVVCPQEMVTLTAVGANNYVWTAPVVNATPFLPLSANQNYIVTGTDLNGCIDRDTVNVSVTLTGCPNFPNTYLCNTDSIRTVYSAAGLVEMISCVGECSMYFLNPQSMSGSQAQAFAQTLGSNLVSIQSQAENNCIMSSLNAMGQSGVIWIGFSDEVTEGTFVWYDQSPVTYTNWAPGEPNQSGNEDCTQIYANGQWNDLPCNTANAQSIIEVNLCPVVNAGSDISICIGATAQVAAVSTILGSAPYTYQWDNGPTTQANPVAPQTDTDYILTVTDRFGCTDMDTTSVIVNPLPVVSAGPDITVCPQEMVTLSGSGANTYVWTAPIVNNVPFLPISVSQDYMVTGTDINGCVGSDTVNVSVVLNGCPTFPNVYLCNPDSIRATFTAAGLTEMVTCVGECSMYFLNPQSMSGSQAQAFAQTLGTNLVSIQSQAENDCIMSALNSMGQSGIIWIGFSDEVTEGTFVWYDQSPVVYTNWAPGEPNNQGNEDCTQIYPNGTWNDLPCGSNNAQSIIEVNLCPVINAGNDMTICVGDTAFLSASNTILGSSPYTYEWDNGVQTQFNPVAPVVTTDYNVTTIDRFECIVKDTVTVTVNPLPIVNAGNDIAVCNQTQVTLSGTGAVNYVWDNGITDGVAFAPPIGINNYVVVGTDANNCENTDTVQVQVYADPVVNAGADFTVCQGTSITLNGTGANTYIWDNGVFDGVAFNINTTTTFTVTGSTAEGCEDTDQITVSVTPTPIVNFAPNINLGCSPFLVTFTNTNIPGTTCAWDFGNGITSNACGPVSTVYMNEGCYTVTMVATTGNGCVGQTTINNVVCVAPDPVAAFVVNPATLSQINPSATMINMSSGAASYLWTFGDGGGANTFAPTHLYPTDEAGTYIITLIATSNIGCTDTAYGEIVVEPALTHYVPNSFTPGNDDGINPTFKPVLSSSFQMEGYTFSIYDRWGQLMFRTADPDLGWDGRFGPNNKLIESGIYVWKLEFMSISSKKTISEMGHVLLLR